MLWESPTPQGAHLNPWSLHLQFETFWGNPWCAWSSISCLSWLWGHVLGQIMRKKSQDCVHHSPNSNCWGAWLAKVPGVCAGTSGEETQKRFPSWEPEENVGSVKGGWGGEQTGIRTKGNCWCKWMPFLRDIDKFLLLFKQPKWFSCFCPPLPFCCCLEDTSGISQDKRPLLIVVLPRCCSLSLGSGSSCQPLCAARKMFFLLCVQIPFGACVVALFAEPGVLSWRLPRPPLAPSAFGAPQIWGKAAWTWSLIFSMYLVWKKGTPSKAGRFLSGIKTRSLMLGFSSWKWSQFPS